jgi:hypothetical protein
MDVSRATKVSRTTKLSSHFNIVIQMHVDRDEVYDASQCLLQQLTSYMMISSSHNETLECDDMTTARDVPAPR